MATNDSQNVRAGYHRRYVLIIDRYDIYLVSKKRAKYFKGARECNGAVNLVGG